MNLHPNENTNCSETAVQIPISDNLAVPIPETTISINLSVSIPEPEVSLDWAASLIHSLMPTDEFQQTIEVQNVDRIV